MRRQVALPGFFTVDAISPDGRWVYLIQYGDDVLDYRVRALDTTSGRLAARDVVDPRKPEEQMGGLPMTRVTSPDGRWAYTLYGGGDETFIHALDTVGRSAACIDLDMLPPDSNLSRVRLGIGAAGRRIDVRDGASLVATVNARTFAVTTPGAAATRPQPPTRSRRAVAPPADDGGLPWPTLLLAAGVAALAAAAVVTRFRRARRPGGRSESTVT
jgi:DNA-binding beta-propeller fold protein YncE